MQSEYLLKNKSYGNNYSLYIELLKILFLASDLSPCSDLGRVENPKTVKYKSKVYKVKSL